MARADLLLIVGHRSKLVLGHNWGGKTDTELAWKGSAIAKSNQKRLRQPIMELTLRQEQGPALTGHERLYQLAVTDNLRASYSKDGVSGNVYMGLFYSWV